MPPDFGVLGLAFFLIADGPLRCRNDGLVAIGVKHVPMPPSPPALETAAVSSAEVQVPIGARMIGTSMPNRGQSGVVSMVSPPHIRARGIANTGNRAASRHLRY